MFDRVQQRQAATRKLLEASHDAMSIFVDHIGGMGPISIYSSLYIFSKILPRTPVYTEYNGQFFPVQTKTISYNVNFLNTEKLATSKG